MEVTCAPRHALVLLRQCDGLGDSVAPGTQHFSRSRGLHSHGPVGGGGLADARCVLLHGWSGLANIWRRLLVYTCNTCTNLGIFLQRVTTDGAVALKRFSLKSTTRTAHRAS